MIPAAELPRAIRLPLAARGVTLPRLFLARLLRYEGVEQAVYVLDGAQALVSEAEVGWLGPKKPPSPFAGFAMLLLGLGGSDVPVTPGHPAVRMMEATVRLAREAGVRVVVVGSPIPFEGMRGVVGYDPEIYRARFRMLQAVVERAGGTFVDLHEALPAKHFQDTVGHFDADGAAVLANLLRPVVTREVQSALRERWFRVLSAPSPQAVAP
jgi:hypothetical protein